MLLPWVAIDGCGRSNRGKVWPLGHANGPSPQLRAPLPEKAFETKGLNGTTMSALLKVCPPSDELANAAPSTKLPPIPLLPPFLANQETYTSPPWPLAIFAPWFLHTLLLFLRTLHLA